MVVFYSYILTVTYELYLDTEQVARGEKKTVVERRKLNMRNTEKSVNTVSTFDCIARSVFLGLQMLKWLSGLPSLKQGMDLRPQEAAQEAFTLTSLFL